MLVDKLNYFKAAYLMLREIFVLYVSNGSISLDQFQALIQMGDALQSQAAKLVRLYFFGFFSLQNHYSGNDVTQYLDAYSGSNSNVKKCLESSNANNTEKNLKKKKYSIPFLETFERH